jgi:hypothetical protein
MFILYGPLPLLPLALAALYIAGSIHVDPLLRRRPIALATAIVATVVGVVSGSVFAVAIFLSGRIA